MPALPSCPVCGSEYTYEDGFLFICPECAHEWTQDKNTAELETANVKDANGTPLNDGDHVIVIKDLKVKGYSNAIKQGTKIKNIHISASPDGHDIDCKIDGFGAMKLKSEFVKKS